TARATQHQYGDRNQVDDQQRDRDAGPAIGFRPRARDRDLGETGAGLPLPVVLRLAQRVEDDRHQPPAPCATIVGDPVALTTLSSTIWVGTPATPSMLSRC